MRNFTMHRRSIMYMEERHSKDEDGKAELFGRYSFCIETDHGI